MIKSGQVDLNESSLESLLIAFENLKDKENRPLCIVPDEIWFTEEALRRWFGWTDEDFK